VPIGRVGEVHHGQAIRSQVGEDGGVTSMGYASPRRWVSTLTT
jgi:hypothetical protein